MPPRPPVRSPGTSRPATKPAVKRDRPSPVKAARLPVPENDPATDNLWQQVTWIDINEHQQGQRIDNFLVKHLKGVPKTRIYRLLREGEVRVNKKRVKPLYTLQTGDQVRIAPVRRASVSDRPLTLGEQKKAAFLSAILFEDEGLIVFNKPAGIAVHGGSGESLGVIEGLRLATGKPWLELVHRIDKETSGLLLIAKKRSTLKRIQDDFREGRVHKTYLALMKGQLEKNIRVDAPLLKVELPGGDRRVRVDVRGKASQTDFKIEQRFRDATLVRALPLTGRTHQIRVHGLSLGHPLAGDDKYGHLVEGPARPAPRLCLHAHALVMPDYPDGFIAPLPADFQQYLATLQPAL